MCEECGNTEGCGDCLKRLAGGTRTLGGASSRLAITSLSICGDGYCWNV